MDDIARELAKRDRHRRRLAMQMTPEQRMAKMAEMQERAWAILRMNPKGYDWFIRRNFKKRAIHVPKPDGQ